MIADDKFRRIFVGNLFQEVTEDDLKERFKSFGNIDRIELKANFDIDGNILSKYAFITMEIDASKLSQCISTYTNTKWKKRVIKIEIARESFMSRLKRERNCTAKQVPNFHYNPIEMVRKHCENIKESAVLTPVRNVSADHIESNGAIELGANNNDKVLNNVPKRTYYTSNEEEGILSSDPNYGKVPLLPNKMACNKSLNMNEQSGKRRFSQSEVLAVKTRRYYSGSSDDSDSDTGTGRDSKRNNGNFISQLVSYDNKCWNSNDEPHLTSSNNVPIGAGLSTSSNIKTGSNRKRRGSDDNQKRLQSVRERQRQIRCQSTKSCVSISSGQNKKIQLGSTDEEEEEEKAVNCSKNMHPLPSLFSDELEKDDDDKTSFKLRPQFEGKMGQKLLNMQSSYSTDERFKIDERFGGIDKEVSTLTKEDQKEEEFEDERIRNINIVNNIIHGSRDVNLKKLISIKKTIFKDSSKLRYDPAEPSHERFIFRNNKDSVVSKASFEEVVAVEKKSSLAPPPIISGDRHYSVSHGKLKDVLSCKNTKVNKMTFSLLEKFGSPTAPTLKNSSNDAVKISNNGKLKHEWLQKNPFKYDSSSEDDDEHFDRVSNDEKTKFATELRVKCADIGGLNSTAEKFFFENYVDDKRLNDEGVRFIMQNKDKLDEIRTRFETERPELASIMKKKYRSKSKKAEKMAFGKRRHGNIGVENKKSFIRRKRWNKINMNKKLIK